MEVSKDEVVGIEIIAGRWGSRLNPVLTIIRPDGIPAHFVDDTCGLSGDI